jgi:hypothetical protein
MKRRKRWFIALSLALLAACVFGWKWTERPPFEFMEGSSLYFVERTERAHYELTYVSPLPASQIMERASGHSFYEGYDEWHMVLPPPEVVDVGIQEWTGADISRFNGTGPDQMPKLPEHTAALIVVKRHPTALD